MLKRLRSVERRAAARAARLARWDRPIATTAERLAAWANMLLVDHGFVRLAYLNLHEFAAGAFRSAQPAPHHLAALKAKGLRTVVSLRGEREHGSWQLQMDACASLGLELVEFRIRSRGAPSREDMLRARDFLAGLRRPVLFHCKSGADRAGFMAALYLLVHENRSVDEALGQLHIRFGHFRFAKTGVLDRFFELYRDDGEARGLGFEEWIETRYDPAALERGFRPGLLSDILVDRVIRRE